jgi:hypothetical protein
VVPVSRVVPVCGPVWSPGANENAPSPANWKICSVSAVHFSTGRCIPRDLCSAVQCSAVQCSVHQSRPSSEVIRHREEPAGGSHHCHCAVLLWIEGSPRPVLRVTSLPRSAKCFQGSWKIYCNPIFDSIHMDIMLCVRQTLPEGCTIEFKQLKNVIVQAMLLNC